PSCRLPLRSPLLTQFASRGADNDLFDMTERRFNEAEVAAIFEQAAEAQQTSQRQLPSGDGMTLTQLQEIGREVGISPEQLAHAVRAIELGGRPTSRHFFGFPVGVGLSIDLNRKLSDEEWDRFVVDLRETFDARGTLRQEGSLRQWVNGNLQAHLEPTTTGHRIRLRTTKGDARGLMTLGLGMIGFAAVSGIAAAASGGVVDSGMLASLGTLATMGAGVFGIGGLRLPGWARLRTRQMQEVAARVADVASSEPPRDSTASDGRDIHS
ncbi:MAG: hypothetical protein ABIR58_08545, partial [Gemmatimonadaceae bacterium]